MTKLKLIQERWKVTAVAAAVTLGAIGWIVAANPAPEEAPVGDMAVVVSGASTEMEPALPDAAHQLLQRVALGGGAATLLTVEGDGQVRSRRTDLTPRLKNGEVIKGKRKRARRAADNVTGFSNQVRAVAAHRPGHQIFNGLLEASTQKASTLVLITNGVEDSGPLSLLTWGFDTQPKQVVAFLRGQGLLPDLTGRRVLLAFSPPAGSQPPLTYPTRLHLEALWKAVLEETGARVEIVSSACTEPPQATATVRPIPVPVIAEPRRRGSSTVYTVPGVLFVGDQARLIDAGKVRDALAVPARQARAGTHRLTLIGHTADDGSGPTGGLELSRRRALVIADLLRSLGVPDSAFGKVAGVGASQPVASPATNPGNRIVEIIVTEIGTTAAATS